MIGIVSAISATLLLHNSNLASKERVRAAIDTAIQRQALVTELIANTSGELVRLGKDTSDLRQRRQALDAKQEVAALATAKAELDRVIELKRFAKAELVRIHKEVDASRQEIEDAIKTARGG